MVARKQQYNQEQSFIQQQQRFNGYRSRQMTQRKKFKPNKKSLEDVSFVIEHGVFWGFPSIL
jgi:hypothetical protein